MKHLLILILALAGCVSSREALRLDVTHPANPAAMQTPYLAERNELLTITNLVDVGKASVEKHPHEHDAHQNAKPTQEPTKP